MLVAKRSTVTALLIGAFAVGCSDDAEPPKDSGVVVSLAFEGSLYVDAALPDARVRERSQRQVASALTALLKLGITLPNRQGAPSGITRQAITVVDPATGITRAASRVRYRFTTVAVAPKPLVERGPSALVALQTADEAVMRRVRPLCSSSKDPRRPLETVFDGTLEACVRAAADERTAIALERRKLEHADREVVSSEFERAFVELEVTLDPIALADGGAGERRFVFVETTAKPRTSPEGPLEIPTTQGTADPLVITPLDDDEPDAAAETEEDREFQRAVKRARMLGPHEEKVNPGENQYGAARTAREYNYVPLYIVIGVLVLFFIGGRRAWDRDSKKR